ncbi:MAG: hypothetical protein ACXWIN_10260 [Burkholderiaceae bacterium]
MTPQDSTPPTGLAQQASGIWYHGTFSAIDQFWPFTHLGTREAAINALALHYFQTGSASDRN